LVQESGAAWAEESVVLSARASAAEMGAEARGWAAVLALESEWASAFRSVGPAADPEPVRAWGCPLGWPSAEGQQSAAGHSSAAEGEEEAGGRQAPS
jgi:hypothetical protein